MEGLRQALCMVYVALAEAAGGDRMLRQANAVIRDGLEDGVITDPVGAWILESLVAGTEAELEKTERALPERSELHWASELRRATAH